jgi:hypothetical protein
MKKYGGWSMILLKVYHTPDVFFSRVWRKITVMSAKDLKFITEYDWNKRTIELTIDYTINNEFVFTDYHLVAVLQKLNGDLPDLPQDLKDEFVREISKFIVQNTGSDVVWSALLRVYKGRFISIASLYQYYRIHALDRIDPRKDLDEAVNELISVELCYYNECFDFTEPFDWMVCRDDLEKEHPLYQKPTLRKYFDLLSDDVTRRWLQNKEKELLDC